MNDSQDTQDGLDALRRRAAAVLEERYRLPLPTGTSQRDVARGDVAVVLAVLGLNDFYAATERAAQQLAVEAQANDDAGYPQALAMGDRYAACRVLLAALTAPEDEA